MLIALIGNDDIGQKKIKQINSKEQKKVKRWKDRVIES
jgi:hypothetical protein